MSHRRADGWGISIEIPRAVSDVTTPPSQHLRSAAAPVVDSPTPRLAPAPVTPLVELRGVCRTFGSDPPVTALRDVDLVLAPRTSVAVVGPSGSGKSTLLNILGCLDRPTAGI